MAYTKAMEDLIRDFMRFPGIGQRSAQRMAFYVLRMPREEVHSLAESLARAKESVRYCRICNNICEEECCGICRDQNRTKDILCVVETPKDLGCIEAAGIFKGQYHVLLGIISPIDGIGPKDLKIESLLRRVKDEQIKEVIFALNSGMEGEATILYIMQLLKPLGVCSTRIASGIPVGMSLEYADRATLSRAIEGRNQIKG